MVMQQCGLLGHSGNIAQSESGRQSCIDAGAPLALTNLAKEKAVKEDSTAAEGVADAYRQITGKAM
jgi:hypothetical protein